MRGRPELLPNVESQARVGAGRPRSRQLDQTIRQATVEILVEAGYDQLTIEGVAGRAGVPRSAIYRRYRSKIELVWNSVYPRITRPLRLRRGDFRTDLRDLIMRNAEFLSRPEVLASAPALALEFSRDPALRDALRTQLNRAATQALAERIDDAMRSGEIQQRLDAVTLHDTITGAILYHLMFVKREDIREFAGRLAQLLLATTSGRR